MSYGNQPGGYGPPQGGGYGSSGGYGPPPGGGYDPYGHGVQPPRGNNGMAIAALIMGIAGLFVCGITSIVGIVLGHVSLGQIRRTGEEGRGLAIAGLVLSYFGVACWLAALLGIWFLAGPIWTSY
ncbi:DUF4190 domain-containing protein [Streptosporangium sp. NPDC087985]|uniref:DUF4190 domain-containing protein n=1 Tax=Streptosporangium sp. NPDC087985 TaxID=3366196 RepID=UPI0037FC78DB